MLYCMHGLKATPPNLCLALKAHRRESNPLSTIRHIQCLEQLLHLSNPLLSNYPANLAKERKWVGVNENLTVLESLPVCQDAHRSLSWLLRWWNNWCCWRDW